MRYLEQQHQGALIDWSKTVKMPAPYQRHKLSDYLFAIPNGEHRKASIAAKLKWQGVKAGVSDLFLPYPRHGYRGLWDEMKKPPKEFKTDQARRDSLTDKQRAWLELMREQGFVAVTTWGWDEAKTFIETYLSDDKAQFISFYKFQVGRE